LEIRDIGSARDGEIAVGKVVKAHGIRGELKVFPYSGRPADFSAYQRLRFQDPLRGTSRVCELAQSRTLANLAILRLAGLDEREGAEALRGWEVLVPRESLPQLPPGGYYWHELDGRAVRTREGMELGRISGRISAGAQDILVVTGAGGEYLIPAVAEIVAGLADDGVALLVTPPPGLLELNK